MNEHKLLTDLLTFSQLGCCSSYVELSKKLLIKAEKLSVFLKKCENLGILEKRNDKGLLLPCLYQPLDITSIKCNIYQLYLEELEILPPFLTIDSTNDYLKRHSSSYDSRFCLCLTEHQQAGRGRFSKTWVSSVGENILMSLHARLRCRASAIGGFSLIVGLSVVDALRQELSINNLSLKWPNDVYWKDSKLAGVLIESTALQDGDIKLIIGVGLNLALSPSDSSEIDQNWVDLKQIMATDTDRNVLIATILNNLISNISLFEKGGFSSFMLRWAELDYLYNREVILNSCYKGISTGIARGVNESGHLLVEAGSECLEISSGEVSVRRLLDRPS